MLQFLFKKRRGFRKTNRPMMLAHRGARKVAPENTIAAFRKAEKLGFDGVEMDIVLTKDKVPVVFHGNDLSHSTRSTGLIHKTLSKDIFKIDAGSLFDKSFEDEKIPSLSEALEYLSGTKMFINLELKSQPRNHSGMERLVAEMIFHYRLYDRVMVSSFSPWILKRFTKICPKIPTALIIGPNPFFFLKTLLFANMLPVSSINPIFTSTTERLVKFAHSLGWTVHVWTLNTRQECMRAIELGVDGIITDEPELLKLVK